jgi:hypothetical protein
MDKSIRAKRNMLEQHSEKIAEEGRGEGRGYWPPD